MGIIIAINMNLFADIRVLGPDEFLHLDEIDVGRVTLRYVVAVEGDRNSNLVVCKLKLQITQ